MTESYVWILESVVYAIHDSQIAEHGGLPGMRDAALLQSALRRPENFSHYENSDIADLAACYGYGIARNHPFRDGNKRTAFVVMELFLLRNGYELAADDMDCVLMMLRVAEGSIAETEFAAWIRNHIEKI